MRPYAPCDRLYPLIFRFDGFQTDLRNELASIIQRLRESSYLRYPPDDIYLGNESVLGRFMSLHIKVGTDH